MGVAINSTKSWWWVETEDNLEAAFIVKGHRQKRLGYTDVNTQIVADRESSIFRTRNLDVEKDRLKFLHGEDGALQYVR